MTDFERTGVGVIIGRFQVPALHSGHKHIMQEAGQHPAVCILLGVAPSLNTVADPLDFPTRAAMIVEYFRSYGLTAPTILPLEDQPTDKAWSKKVDQALRAVYPLERITIYGGEDSFIPHYSGGHNTRTVTDKPDSPRGTELRLKHGRIVKPTVDFRAGVIYASQSVRPRINLCVDIAVTRRSSAGELQILLGQKSWEEGHAIWRLPGGFVDPSDTTALRAAQRELREETQLTPDPGGWSVVSCRHVPDWRDTEGQCIFSTLYHADHDFGMVVASDDLATCKWLPFEAVMQGDVKLTVGHIDLFDDLVDHLEKRGKLNVSEQVPQR